jgi:hypothetical protein
MSSVADHGVAEREAGILAKRKEQQSRALSAASAGSKGSRRSRRSVSLGGLDGDEVVRAISVPSLGLFQDRTGGYGTRGLLQEGSS